MLKKVLESIGVILLCAMACSPLAVVFLLSWEFIINPSWVMKCGGVWVAIMGLIFATLPSKLIYLMLREVWDSNFTWEFQPPAGT